MDAKQNAASTPLCWTDGKTTKYIELLNWYTVGLMSVSSTSTTSPRLTSVIMHLTDSDYDLKTHSTRPLCQRPDYKSSADALVSIQQAQGKGVLHIPIFRCICGRISRHFHPQHRQKAQRDGVPHFDGPLKGGKTKNGENCRRATSLTCCHVHLNRGSICCLVHFSDFFLAVSRPDVAVARNATVCVQSTPHRTHTRALFSR